MVHSKTKLLHRSRFLQESAPSQRREEHSITAASKGEGRQEHILLSKERSRVPDEAPPRCEPACTKGYAKASGVILLGKPPIAH